MAAGQIPGIRLLIGGQFLATAGLMVMVPLLPLLMRELGAVDVRSNGLWSGLALAAPAVTHMICAPLWGRAGDRWGRKWMVVRALLGLGLALILMGLAQTPLQFVLCRLLQGACGGIVDATSAYAGAESSPEQRGRVLGLLQSSTAAGSLVGPLIGGLMADLVGFADLLVMMGVLTAGCGVLISRRLKTSLSASAPFQAVPAPASLRREFAGIWRHPRLRAFVVTGICAQIGMYGIVTAFAPHVEARLVDDRYLATWVGALQALAWGAGMIGGYWWGRRNDAKPVESNLFWALLGCGLSVVLQAVPQQAEWLIPLRMMQGFCFSALIQSVFLAIAQTSDKRNCGVRIGAAQSFLTVGQIIGSLVGAALGMWLSTSAVFLVMGGLIMLGAWRLLPAGKTVNPVREAEIHS